MAASDELSADYCGSGEGSVSSTAGPVAEPDVGGCRCPTDRAEFHGAAPVDVNSGQEDRSCVLTVVPEPVSSAAASDLEVDDPYGDVVLAVGGAPVDGQLERPAVEISGVLADRKRLSLAVGDKRQNGLFGFQTVGQGDCREGCQKATRRRRPQICRSAVQTTGATSNCADNCRKLSNSPALY